MSEQKAKEIVRHYLVTITSDGTVSVDVRADQNNARPVKTEVGITVLADNPDLPFDVAVRELHIEDASDFIGGFFTPEEYETHLNRFFDTTTASAHQNGYEIVNARELGFDGNYDFLVDPDETDGDEDKPDDAGNYALPR